MITLIIVRHGEAEPQMDGKDDKDRKLVKKGIKQMKRVASFLDELDYAFDKVFTSPYIRAYQSAETILDEMGIDDKKIETFNELSPDQEPSTFVEKLKEMDNTTLLVVGHEPYLSSLVRTMTGGNVELKKGGVAIVDYNPTEGKGVIKMLLTQKVLKLV
ncbi:phosphohistidine phosphatase SixA [Acidianus sp. HS-5]|uniref:phosphohistidine phosphatase SixA n=1 Tax=Acidianus sp. HS-5 TaxID=2886040 RepID=UPI001F02CDCA|nr:phosphohistidine phosphatase SixA [Acidianus sp. HS-5]BDC18931.1 phosphohistidine phosphatase SixA [Acidianus sp. HS-5]